MIYPASNTDLYLGDVLFFNMLAQIHNLKIACHTYTYFQVNLDLNLFQENVIALFSLDEAICIVPGTLIQNQSPPHKKFVHHTASNEDL